MKKYNWGKWRLISKNSVQIAKKIVAMATTEAEREYMLRKVSPTASLAVRTILSDYYTV